MTSLYHQKYFILNEDCSLIKGVVKGAIYNFSNEEVYSLNREELLILENLEKFKKIEEILNNNKISEVNLLDFLEQLSESGMGNFYETPVYMDKYIEYYQRDPLKKLIHLDTLIIEPHRRCNLNCEICVDNMQNRNERFLYCGCRKENKSPILSVEEIKKIIRDSQKYDLDSVFFSGGDPFLYKAEMIKIFHLCKEKVKNVSAHTHATNLDNECIDILSDLEINLDIPVYSHEEDVHDNFVNSKGNYRKLISTIELLLKKGVQFVVIIYISEMITSDLYKTIDFFINLGCKVSHKFVYPLDKIKENIRFIEIYNEIKKEFPPLSKSAFLVNKEGSFCLPRKIAITSEGNITPCHIAINDVLGNIKNVKIDEIIRRGKLEPYWNMSKEKSKTCNQCEFRYLCSDCPILEHRRDREIIYENKYCKYNPVTGEWEI